MKKMMTLLAALAALTAATASPVPLVTVGDPGNAGKRVPFGQFVRNAYPRGGVPYVYRMGQREVTTAQFAEFLNHCPVKYLPFINLEDTGIRREGGKFVPLPGEAEKPVRNVSRAAAALWCNWASGAEVYRFTVKENHGVKKLHVLGDKDLFTPQSPVLYYLPDMHEFYKAGFYEGNGRWRIITAANRYTPSHYGLKNVADGVSEWMNNHYVESTFALGASDAGKSASDWNALDLHKTAISDAHVDRGIGFRVAATASVAIAPRLNGKNNFFYPGDTEATLRLRSEKAGSVSVTYAFYNLYDQKVGGKTQTVSLKPGVSDLHIPLPAEEGFYRCIASLPDGTTLEMPFEVIKTKRHAEADGHFGLCAHVIRSERGWCRQPFDFQLFRETGSDWMRTDTFTDPALAAGVFRRLNENQLRGLAVMPAMPKAEQWLPGNPELVKKWAARGVSPEVAECAEMNEIIAKAIAPYHPVLEMGNEPQWWFATLEDYTGYARQIAPILRRNAPGCPVMCADLSSGVRAMLRGGAGDVSDILSIHCYCNIHQGFWGLVGWMRRLNGHRRAYGLEAKPFWFTESNICTYSDLYLIPGKNLRETLDYQAMCMPKQMVTLLAYGCKKVIPYLFQDPIVDSREESFGLIDRDGLPKPVFATFRQAAEQLHHAKFEGFLKGHEVKSGCLFATSFRQMDGTRTVVLWRNDAYSQANYSAPYRSIHKPAQIYLIKGSGTALLSTADGKNVTLHAHNGVFFVPVDEYACYLTGAALEPEFVKEETTFSTPVPPRPEVIVQILPNGGRKAMFEMAGRVVKAVPAAPNVIKVRVHNLTKQLVTGDVALLSPDFWRAFDWQFSPVKMKLTIPAGGFATAEFIARPSVEFDEATEGLDLQAVFTRQGDKTLFFDTVKTFPKPELAAAEWQAVGPGWSLAAAGKGLLLSWQNEHRLGALMIYRRRPVLADSPKALEKHVVAEFAADRAVQAIGILTIDAKGETFMLHRRLQSPARSGQIVFDCRDLAVPGKFISYGGNKDKIIQYPLTMQGIGCDFTPADRIQMEGHLLFKSFRVEDGAAATLFTKTNVPLVVKRATPQETKHRVAVPDPTSDAVIENKPVRSPAPAARPAAFNASLWKSASQGWTLRVDGTFGWQEPSHRFGGLLVYKRRPVLARTQADLAKEVRITFSSDFRVQSAAILTIDAQGETFMLHRRFSKPLTRGPVTFDCRDLAVPGKFISYGGNKDKVIQYPLTMQGIAFDPARPDEKRGKGTLKIQGLSIQVP